MKARKEPYGSRRQERTRICVATPRAAPDLIVIRNPTTQTTFTDISDVSKWKEHSIDFYQEEVILASIVHASVYRKTQAYYMHSARGS